MDKMQNIEVKPVSFVTKSNKGIKRQLLLLDNSRIASYYCTSFRIWTLPNMQTPELFSTKTDSIKSAIYLQNKTIAIGLNDGQIQLRHNETFKVISILQGHTKTVLWLLESKFNNNTLISGSIDNSMRIWNLLTCQCLSKLQLFSIFSICPLELNPSRLVINNFNDSIKILHSNKLRLIKRLRINDNISSMIKLDNKRIALGCNKAIHIIRINNNIKLKTIKTAYQGNIFRLTSLNDTMVICCCEYYIYVIDVVSDNCVFTFKSNDNDAINSILLLPDNYLAYYTSNPELQFVKLDCIKENGVKFSSHLKNIFDNFRYSVYLSN